MSGLPLVRKLFESLHALAAAAWLGGVAMAGVVAAMTFPLMRELQPTSAKFAAYDGEHWNLIAGQVASRVFWVADAVSLGGAILATLCVIVLILSGGLALARISSGVRLLALGAGLTALAYQLFVLGPRMYENLRRYWEEALAGNTPEADAFRQAFSADHGAASSTLGAMAVCALALLVSGVWSAASGGERARAGRRSPDGPSLPEPELARRAR